MSPKASTASVQRGKRHVIQPQDPSALDAIPNPFKLGPLDLITLYFIPVAVVFIYESTTSSSEPINPGRLQSALSLLLDYYPHLSGRFRIDILAGNHTIDRLGSGAVLQEASVDRALAAYRKSDEGPYSILDLPGAGNDLLAEYDSSLEALGRDPIFTVQHTRFTCGGVALGIRCPHIVTDADGFFRLAGDLGRIYRGLRRGEEGKLQPGMEPTIIPYLADFGGEAELESARAYRPSLFSVVEPLAPPIAGPALEPDATIPAPPKTSSAAATIVGRELHFSSADLAALRKRATDPSHPDRRITSYIALSAWLYQQIHRSRLILESEQPETQQIVTTDFLTPLNLRVAERLPDLPPNYFPNAVMTHYTTVSSSTLDSAPLSEVARHLQEMITTRAVVGSDLRHTVEWLAAQPNKNHVQFGMKHGRGAFMISAWNKIDMYGEGAVCFEEETKPVLVSPPFTPISLIDGLAYVLPPHPKGGELAAGDGVVVYLSLSPALWEVIDRGPGLVRWAPGTVFKHSRAPETGRVR